MLTSISSYLQSTLILPGGASNEAYEYGPHDAKIKKYTMRVDTMM